MDDVRLEAGVPSAFFEANSERLRSAARLGQILDLACGRGRHSLAAAALGLEVLAVDRNADSLAQLASVPLVAGRIELLKVDLEGEAPPALGPAKFGAILVFRYLHRPLMAWIEGLLAPEGLLLYETFTTQQRALGWGPKSEEFLLNPGELPSLFPGLEIESYEEGETNERQPAQTARLVASKPGDRS